MLGSSEFDLRELRVEATAISFSLELLEGVNLCAQLGALRGHARSAVLKDFVRGNGTEVEPEVHAVQQRSGNACPISPNRGRRIRAGEPWMSQAPARTGVHRGDELKIRRKDRPPLAAADADLPRLKRLAKGLQAGPLKLRKFVQKQNPPVGEADFPRPRRRTTPDQTRVADGVVRSAKGGPTQMEKLTEVPLVFYAPGCSNAQDLKPLVFGKGREDALQAASQEGFSAAGRAGHQKIVPPRSSEAEGEAGAFLSLDPGQIGDLPAEIFQQGGMGTGLLPIQGLGDMNLPQALPTPAQHSRQNIDQFPAWQNLEIPARPGRQGSVFVGTDQRVRARIPCKFGQRQDPGDREQATVQPDLPDEKLPPKRRVPNSPAQGREHHCKRKIHLGPRLPLPPRREVDHKAPPWKRDQERKKSRANPLERLPDGRVRQAEDHRVPKIAPPHRGFNLYGQSPDTIEDTRPNPEHSPFLLSTLETFHKRRDVGSPKGSVVFQKKVGPKSGPFS